mgnify:CR=1 FL=1
MPSSRESVDLYGGKARRFRELQDELEEELGYRPTKPETIGHLFEHYDGPLLESSPGN